MRSKRAANSSSSRTIFSLLSFLLLLLLMGGGGGIVVVSASSGSFRRRRREERMEDMRGVRARHKRCLAVPLLGRLSLFYCLFFCRFVFSFSEETRDEGRETRIEQRERRRTDPIECLYLGISFSQREIEIFFFVSTAGQVKPFLPRRHESSSLFPPALNLWFCVFY